MTGATVPIDYHLVHTACLQVQPDFVPLSFYKLFGYPTGLGALLVRKEAARQLNKVYFGGGSVDYCTAEDVWHVLSAPPAGVLHYNSVNHAALCMTRCT